jgi:hypothetical protein
MEFCPNNRFDLTPCLVMIPAKVILQESRQGRLQVKRMLGPTSRRRGYIGFLRLRSKINTPHHVRKCAVLMIAVAHCNFDNVPRVKSGIIQRIS